MKKLFFLFSIIFYNGLNAQIVFEKGYFIDNTGNRTACFIKNLDWRDSPTEFLYKISESSEEVNANISNIKEFGVGEIIKYKRFKINMEHSSTITNKLLKNRYPEFKTETVFLKVLVSGDANLYVYKDGTIVKFFYDNKNVPTEQLVYIRYINEKGEAAENNQFRQQLLNALKCDKIEQSEIAKIKYSESEISNIFLKSNSCGSSVTPTVSYKRVQTKNPFALRVQAGVGTASLSLGGFLENGNDINFKNESVVKYGLDAEYILPFNKDTWSIFVSPVYHKLDFKKEYYGADVYGNPIKNEAELNYKTIEIPVGIRHYFFLNTSSKIFVDAAYVIRAGENNSTIILSENRNDFYIDATYPIESNSNFALGLGYNYKSLGISVRLNTGRNLLSQYSLTDARYTTIALMLSYKVF